MTNVIKIIILLFILQSCVLNFKRGFRGQSESIEESKERSIFICEYEYTITPDLLRKYFDIKDIFVEKSWIYGRKNKDTEIIIGKDGKIHYQLVFVFYDYDNYDFIDMDISVSNENINFGSYKYNFYSYLNDDTSLIADTIVLNIYLNKEYKIGELFLKKKK